jgi:hypothetical protein
MLKIKVEYNPYYQGEQEITVETLPVTWNDPAIAVENLRRIVTDTSEEHGFTLYTDDNTPITIIANWRGYNGNFIRAYLQYTNK